LPQGIEVAPGEQHTFQFIIRAPNQLGEIIRCTWRMLSENERWFGEWKDNMIQISRPEIWVSKDGDDETGEGTISSPFLTIQHGIDMVAEKGIVHIRPGDYYENVEIDKALTLESDTEYHQTRIIAVNESRINQGGRERVPPTIWIHDVEGDGLFVRIEGFEITMTESLQNDDQIYPAGGIIYEQVDHLEIFDNLIRNNKRGLSDEHSDTRNLFVMGNKMINNNNFMIKFSVLNIEPNTVGDVFIVNNVISGNLRGVIALIQNIQNTDPFSLKLLNNTISDNVTSSFFAFWHGSGIFLQLYNIDSLDNLWRKIEIKNNIIYQNVFNEGMDLIDNFNIQLDGENIIESNSIPWSKISYNLIQGISQEEGYVFGEARGFNIDEDPLFVGDLDHDSLGELSSLSDFDYHLQSPFGYYVNELGGYTFNPDASYSSSIDSGKPPLVIISAYVVTEYDTSVPPHVRVTVPGVHDLDEGVHVKIVVRKGLDYTAYEFTVLGKISDDEITQLFLEPKTEIYGIENPSQLPYGTGDLLVTETSDFTNETYYHGERINIGAYGGTEQSSISLGRGPWEIDLEEHRFKIDDSEIEEWISIKPTVDAFSFEEVEVVDDEEDVDLEEVKMLRILLDPDSRPPVGAASFHMGPEDEFGSKFGYKPDQNFYFETDVRFFGGDDPSPVNPEVSVIFLHLPNMGRNMEFGILKTPTLVEEGRDVILIKIPHDNPDDDLLVTIQVSEFLNENMQHNKRYRLRQDWVGGVMRFFINGRLVYQYEQFEMDEVEDEDGVERPIFYLGAYSENVYYDNISTGIVAWDQEEYFFDFEDAAQQARWVEIVPELLWGDVNGDEKLIITSDSWAFPGAAGYPVGEQGEGYMINQDFYFETDVSDADPNNPSLQEATLFLNLPDMNANSANMEYTIINYPNELQNEDRIRIIIPGYTADEFTLLSKGLDNINDNETYRLRQDYVNGVLRFYLNDKLVYKYEEFSMVDYVVFYIGGYNGIFHFDNVSTGRISLVPATQ